MDWRSTDFDWNHLRTFLVSAEEGSFSAASRALGLTQPTVGRQISALEETLGVTLFERGARSLSLTETGLDLMDHVRAMEAAANQVSLSASGRAQSVEGTVCITTTHGVAMHLLPPAVRRIRTEAPGIHVEILASNDNRDLQRREADIAVRHVQPSQPDLIAKFLRNIRMRLYARSEYLDAVGRRPATADLTDMEFIGFDRTPRLSGGLRQAGVNILEGRDDDYFHVSSESGAVIWSLIEAGLGVSIMMDEVAARMPDMECAFPDMDPIDIPMWLVTHREVRTSKRIRLVYDILADELAGTVRS